MLKNEFEICKSLHFIYTLVINTLLCLLFYKYFFNLRIMFCANMRQMFAQNPVRECCRDAAHTLTFTGNLMQAEDEHKHLSTYTESTDAPATPTRSAPGRTPPDPGPGPGPAAARTQGWRSSRNLGSLLDQKPETP